MGKAPASHHSFRLDKMRDPPRLHLGLQRTSTRWSRTKRTRLSLSEIGSCHCGRRLGTWISCFFFFFLIVSSLSSFPLGIIKGSHASQLQSRPTHRRTRAVPRGELQPGTVEEADGWVHGHSRNGDMAIDLSQVIFSAPPPSPPKEMTDNITTTAAPAAAAYENATLDIAMFRLPTNGCGPSNCDYPRLGVGTYIPVEESSAGLRLVAWCDEGAGRLYLDSHKFDGIHVSLTIPLNEDMPLSQPPQTIYPVGKKGHYMVLIANCNRLAQRTVYFEGRVQFSSPGGSGDKENDFVSGFKNWGFVMIAVVYLSMREYNGRLARRGYQQEQERLGRDTETSTQHDEDYDVASSVEMAPMV